MSIVPTRGLWFLSQEYRFDRYGAVDGPLTCFDPLGSSGLFNGDPPSDFIYSAVQTPQGFWISSSFNGGDPLNLRHISEDGLTTLASFTIPGQTATGYLNAMARRASGNLLIILNGRDGVSEYTPLGVLVATYDIGALAAIALGPDNTTLYYGVSGDSVLHAWDLTSDTALPDWGDLGESWLNAGNGGLSLQALSDGRMLITAKILDGEGAPTWLGAQLWAADGLSIQHSYGVALEPGYDNLTAIADPLADRIYIGTGLSVDPTYGADLYSFILSTEVQEWTFPAFAALAWEEGVSGNFGGLLIFGQAGEDVCVHGEVVQEPRDLHIGTGTVVSFSITITPEAPPPPDPDFTRTDGLIYDPNAGFDGTFHGTLYKGAPGDTSTPLSPRTEIIYTVVFQTPEILETGQYWVDVEQTCPGQDPFHIPMSGPFFIITPTPIPHITSLSVDCATGNLVLVGTGFATNASVALTRDGIAQGFTFVSKTPTRIVLRLPAFVAGRYCAIVTTPTVGSSEPLCADLACQQAAISRLAVDCPSSMVIVTGTGFGSSTVIAVTRNAVTRSFTLAGITATEIRLFIPGVFQDGQYCVTVVNPGTASLGPFCAQLSCPTGPPPPPPPPTPGGGSGGGPGTECDSTLPQPTCLPVTD